MKKNAAGSKSKGRIASVLRGLIAHYEPLIDEAVARLDELRRERQRCAAGAAGAAGSSGSRPRRPLLPPVIRRFKSRLLSFLPGRHGPPPEHDHRRRQQHYRTQRRIARIDAEIRRLSRDLLRYRAELLARLESTMRIEVAVAV